MALSDMMVVVGIVGQLGQGRTSMVKSWSVVSVLSISISCPQSAHLTLILNCISCLLSVRLYVLALLECRVTWTFSECTEPVSLAIVLAISAICLLLHSDGVWHSQALDPALRDEPFATHSDPDGRYLALVNLAPDAVLVHVQDTGKFLHGIVIAVCH